MNKDRIDLTAGRLASGGDVYDEVALLFSPTATPDAPAPAGGLLARRVMRTADGETFVLPRYATLIGARVVPYPAGFSPVYTGALTDAERAQLGTPRIELRRNTDTTSYSAATDHPIKIFAPTDPAPPAAGAQNTMGMVTDKLVIELSKANIGVATHYTIFGEGTLLNNVATEGDALGMNRIQGQVFPHADSVEDDQAVFAAPCVIVGLTTTSPIRYDVALVLSYRMPRDAFTSIPEFPPNLEKDLVFT
jgi:hypothetical protein